MDIWHIVIETSLASNGNSGKFLKLLLIMRNSRTEMAGFRGSFLREGFLELKLHNKLIICYKHRSQIDMCFVEIFIKYNKSCEHILSSY